MSQLDLITGEPVPEPRDPNALTDRQQYALETIGRYQPIASDELGADLHQYRLEHGGRGHSRDERCEWCAGEGREMGEALKRRDLVIYKRTIGWCLPDYRPEPADSSYDPTTSEIPF